MRLDPTFGDLTELRRKMVQWARKLTRGGHHAEDLVQTALIKMIANRNRVPLDRIEPWARVVLLNTFQDGLRSDKRRPHFVDCENALLVSPDNPETQTYCRQIFALCVENGAEHLLAEIDGPMTNTQRTQRRRARMQLERVAA